VSPLIMPCCIMTKSSMLIVWNAEVRIRNLRLGETQFTGRARDESGTRHRASTDHLTESLILRPRKRRNSGGWEDFLQSSPLRYD